MVKSPYNLNNNWIQEYHDKHGKFTYNKYYL